MAHGLADACLKPGVEGEIARKSCLAAGALDFALDSQQSFQCSTASLSLLALLKALGRSVLDKERVREGLECCYDLLNSLDEGYESRWDTRRFELATAAFDTILGLVGLHAETGPHGCQALLRQLGAQRCLDLLLETAMQTDPADHKPRLLKQALAWAKEACDNLEPHQAKARRSTLRAAGRVQRALLSALLLFPGEESLPPHLADWVLGTLAQAYEWLRLHPGSEVVNRWVFQYVYSPVFFPAFQDVYTGGDASKLLSFCCGRCCLPARAQGRPSCATQPGRRYCFGVASLPMFAALERLPRFRASAARLLTWMALDIAEMKQHVGPELMGEAEAALISAIGGARRGKGRAAAADVGAAVAAARLKVQAAEREEERESVLDLCGESLSDFGDDDEEPSVAAAERGARTQTPLLLARALCMLTDNTSRQDDGEARARAADAAMAELLAEVAKERAASDGKKAPQAKSKPKAKTPKKDKQQAAPAAVAAPEPEEVEEDELAVLLRMRAAADKSAADRRGGGSAKPVAARAAPQAQPVAPPQAPQRALAPIAAAAALRPLQSPVPPPPPLAPAPSRAQASPPKSKAPEPAEYSPSSASGGGSALATLFPWLQMDRAAPPAVVAPPAAVDEVHEDDHLCVVCLDAPREATLAGCADRHAPVLCEDCVAMLMGTPVPTCPLCRAPTPKA